MENTFPQFDYAAHEITAYIFRANTFILSLRNKQIIRHSSADPDGFKKWLEHHKVKDVTEQTGTLVLNYYFQD